MVDMNGNPRKDISVGYHKHDSTMLCRTPDCGTCEFIGRNYVRWPTTWNAGLFDEEITITYLMLAGF